MYLYVLVCIYACVYNKHYTLYSVQCMGEIKYYTCYYNCLNNCIFKLII